VILMGSGSEVSLCVEAGEKLNAAGIKARVVSMPSWELFERQDAAYKESVLPASVSARVSVEMASTFGWERYTGPKGKIIGMRSFGASAPLKDLLKKFGMEADKVVAAAREVLGSETAMKIVIGSDHAGFQMKAAMGDLLRALGHDVLDVGAFNENPSDYPDFAEAVGRAVLDRKAERGVLICAAASARAWRQISCRGSGRRCATIPIPRIRAWSTTI